MAVEGRLTKKKMIDTASLFKQRRRSIGCGAGSRPAEAGERGLKVAPRGRAASPPARPRAAADSAARRLAGRVTAGGVPLPANLLRLASEKLQTRQTNSPNGREAGEGQEGRGRRGLGFRSPRGAAWRARCSPGGVGDGGAGSRDLQGGWRSVYALVAILFSPRSPSLGGAGR